MMLSAFQWLNEHQGGRRESRAGMTLIEMMVVILVIAILFSIMMPAIGRMRQRVREAEAEATAAALYDAILQYHFEYGVWPIDYGSSQSGGEYVFRDNNHEVLKRLIADHEDNQKEISFIYPEDYWDTTGDPPENPENDPVLDPWGTPYRITIDTTKASRSGAVEVRSAGSDKTFE